MSLAQRARMAERGEVRSAVPSSFGYCPLSADPVAAEELAGALLLPPYVLAAL